MKLFWIIAVVALAFSSVGFKKYVWFISIGYGFSIAAIGAGLLITGKDGLNTGIVLACILFILYGIRLGGYLAIREWKSSTYNSKMMTEIKSGKGMSVFAKCAIWVSAALLYACETYHMSPEQLEEHKADIIFYYTMDQKPIKNAED